MYIDLTNTNDRLILEVYGKETDSIFDLNETYTSKEFKLEENTYLRNLAFVINELIKDQVCVEILLSDKPVGSSYIHKVIEDNTLWEEEDISKLTVSVMNSLRKVLPKVYTPFGYEDNEDDDYEIIHYDTRKSKYIDLDEVHLYKVQDKNIYEYNIDSGRYKVLAKLY